jgi:hypothetical protein
MRVEGGKMEDRRNLLESCCSSSREDASRRAPVYTAESWEWESRNGARCDDGLTDEASVAVQVLRQSRTHRQRPHRGTRHCRKWQRRHAYGRERSETLCEQDRRNRIRGRWLRYCRSSSGLKVATERTAPDSPATGIVEFILEHAAGECLEFSARVGWEVSSTSFSGSADKGTGEFSLAW